MYHILQSMYSEIKSCVRASNDTSQYFDCPAGVRQGCILSPILFSFYIEELNTMLMSSGQSGIQLTQDMYDLFALLYADDVIIFADSVTNLQHLIDILSTFCTKWRMQVNLAKTKAMVFRRGGHLSRFEKWYFDGNVIETVSYYKYLGLLLSSRNNWSKAVSSLAKQASKSMTSLSIARKKLEFVDPNVHFKLFDVMILPILTYGSEFWGYQYYDALEKIQRSWCRKLLGDPTTAANEAVVGECGRLPIYYSTLKRCIKFWLNLLEMPAHRIPRQAYLMLCNLDNMGRNTWATSVKKILYSFGFGFAWIAQEVGDKQLFLSTFELRVKDVLKQQWKENLGLKPKLRTYIHFKNLLQSEKYLYLNCNRQAIRALACLRLSVLPLEIENGRRRNIPPTERFCKICNTNMVEDEYHFLVICPLYNNLRIQYLPCDMFLEPNFIKFTKIMRSTDSNILLKLCNFVHKAIRLRDKVCLT
ncbi:uncharacterized protein LOC144435518 [Glandiceps talaboti]